ncbi:MAG: protein kinase [Candidatus Eisenbacteria bacterium]|uniref:Protein kinase n=1 Tax=Eiseniibacteriota bacterium TaxID=2212470 RepID=A0A948RZW5_UNCEI|nr:protein kinase [Candidatus Eisenbacteria bacterium]MBU1948857.1 protein kinase [Candidatus Eisenbacteria bacterium]MBU2691279.1 protein kinase [Candidatus Eisenbacteria bacterium]
MQGGEDDEDPRGDNRGHPDFDEKTINSGSAGNGPLDSGSIGADPISAEHGRFIPGTVFAKRYRIVSLIGRGGMGEVYRADDLELGSPVALKLLPYNLAGQKAALDLLRSEVRIARQVTHPNVCRIYDIGESDGQYFISMEYIDGEDLASVIRRMGRPTEEKALNIARQICSGLSAAHDIGVLHRDLKPANIMLDGRGRIRIMDFGLAGLAKDLTSPGKIAGTPQYMAPEQLSGQGVTLRSDVYSLGLVLFELFTGRRAYEVETVKGLQKLHETGPPSSVSDLVRGIDPLIEQLIARCLSRLPAERPSSAQAVAISLPGGDPLAAAIAAGETPSPEMVAAAGGKGALSPLVRLGLLLGTLISILILAFLDMRPPLLQVSPHEKSPEILKNRAREIINRFGYEEKPQHSGLGFKYRWAYIDRLAERLDFKDPLQAIEQARPTSLWFWYRQSQHAMTAQEVFRASLMSNVPGVHERGMISATIDLDGRVMEFRAIPEDPYHPVEWIRDPQNPDTILTDQGNTNSLLIIDTEGRVIGTDGSPRSLAPGNTITYRGPPLAVAGEILFCFNAPEAEQVYLSGDFNNWSQKLDAMTRGVDGVWRIALPLPPGNHSYKYVLRTAVEPVHWPEILEAAGYEPDRFTKSAPLYIPQTSYDEIVSWKGSISDNPNVPLCIEAASLDGKIVLFQTTFWGGILPATMEAAAHLSVRGSWWNIFSLIFLGFIILTAIYYARQNVKLGKSDRRSATKLAILVFFVFFVRELCSAPHYPNFSVEIEVLINSLIGISGVALLLAGFVWLIYVVVEPYMRRHSPERITSWNRLLAGRWKDPLVGRDLLIGSTMAAAMALIEPIYLSLLPFLSTRKIVGQFNWQTLLGGRYALAGVPDVIIKTLPIGLLFLVLFPVLKVVARKDWIVALIIFLFIGIGQVQSAIDDYGTGAPTIYYIIGFALVASTFISFLIIRLRLLAFVAALWILNILNTFPISLDLTTWYAGTSIFGFLLLAALPLFGYWTSKGSGASLDMAARNR